MIDTHIPYHVGMHGAFYATRATGADIRLAVEAALAKLPAEWGIVLDFGGVEAMTGGFADELVAVLTVRHGERITVTGANPDVAETIALAIARRTP